MAEQRDVFVFANANDVRQLAPEQIRQGRFGQAVFVDLPTPEDHAAIFRVHLSKRGRDPAAFELGRLAEATEGFSGAEIEAAVKAPCSMRSWTASERSPTPTCCGACARSVPRPT